MIFYFILAVVTICYLLFKRIVRSPFGVSLRGIRDNPQKMAAMGFGVSRQKFVAIIISAFFCSIAGILWCILFNVIAPENVSNTWAIMLVFIVMLGGANRLEGSFLGSLIYIFAEDWLSGLTQRYRMIIGVCFILLVIFCQNGILGANYGKMYLAVKKKATEMWTKMLQAFSIKGKTT